MNVLGVIPARGGSKAIPRKNLVELGGKPLIQYTIEAALASYPALARIIVSTEDAEIAEVSRACGAEVPFVRPFELAEDKASSVDVLRHALRVLQKENGARSDWVMLLQPTTPFRTTADIAAALEIARRGGCDSVISVVRVIDSHPARVKKIVDDGLEPFCVKEEEGTRRQDLQPPAFKRNGAIYLTRHDVVMEQRSIWGRVIRPYLMPPERSLNIDSPFDLLVARALRAHRHPGS